jgi:insulysin
MLNSSGETDIANIKNISKEELLTFYNKYIHPSSPHRSVLSVHVKSQIEHHPPTLEDQLAQGVRLFITNEGYDIPPTEVTEAVQGDLSLVPQKIYALILKHGYNQERVAKSLAKGADMFTAMIAPTANGTVKEDGIKTQVLKEVRIEDLQKFRATLEVGGKPAPVQPLETFYECESPKL